jgi:prephenate dehydratase
VWLPARACAVIIGSMSTRVAFQGEAGAFSEDAVHVFFAGDDVALVPERDFTGVAHTVTSRAADFGVLPVENSIHGSVIGAYDVLGAGGLTVIGEVVRPIRHCLLGMEGALPEQVRRVISHPVALAQCTRYLASLPHAEVVAFYDTAGAAREVAQRREPALAAVAGHTAAERYGLTVLAEDIQDRADNATRFFVVRRSDDAEAMPSAAAGAAYKAVLVLETKHRPGALVDALLPFAKRDINLTRLESRPADQVWSYRFFLELVTSDLDALDAAFNDVRARAARVLVIGVFAVSAG